jgi:hypothetical protein
VTFLFFDGSDLNGGLLRPSEIIVGQRFKKFRYSVDRRHFGTPSNSSVFLRTAAAALGATCAPVT